MVKAYFFLKWSGRSPVLEHIQTITDQTEIAKVHSAVDVLMKSGGRLPYPLAEHIEGKIWALRLHSGNQRIYYCLDGQNIILLDGYKKKSMKIERHVIKRIRAHYQEYMQSKRRTQYVWPK